MNKLTKGAVAMGVGTALLLGGAGTFAYWNQSANAGAGKITAGNLELKAKTTGQWKDAKGQEINVSTYKVVPGDKLTYTQDLKVTLVGDKLAANLSLSKNPENLFSGAKVSDITITKKTSGKEEVVRANTVLKPADNGDLTASVTFELPSDKVTDREDVNATYDLSKVEYKLEQVHQEGLQTPQPTPSS